MRESRARSVWFLWLLAGLALLYFAAWGLTATVGIAEVKQDWEWGFGRSAVETVREEEFDPSRFVPPEEFAPPRYFIGRYHAWVPFRVSLVEARWNSSGGLASRVRISWFFGRMKLLEKETIWTWKRPP